MENKILLEVENLRKYFAITKGAIRRHKIAEIKAVDGISFSLRRGETLGIVGESGCGKTTLGRCILRIYRPTSGKLLFEGKDLTELEGEALRQIRRKIQMVFQDPFGSLDPRMNCGNIVGEPLKVHGLARGKEYREQVFILLEAVKIDASMAFRFPHELSGGQRQRIAIARALALKPSLVVCDEPVSALDVSIQAQIINLLENIQSEFNLTYLFISHDLSVVRHLSNKVAVMYLGRIVEIASKDDLFGNPLHPYTIALLSAVPIPDPVADSMREQIVLRGDVPSALRPPPGCAFHNRCLQAMPICSKEVPYLKNIDNEDVEHGVACWRV